MVYKMTHLSPQDHNVITYLLHTPATNPLTTNHKRQQSTWATSLYEFTSHNQLQLKLEEYSEPEPNCGPTIVDFLPQQPDSRQQTALTTIGIEHVADIWDERQHRLRPPIYNNTEFQFLTRLPPIDPPPNQLKLRCGMILCDPEDPCSAYEYIGHQSNTNDLQFRHWAIQSNGITLKAQRTDKRGMGVKYTPFPEFLKQPGPHTRLLYKKTGTDTASILHTIATPLITLPTTLQQPRPPPEWVEAIIRDMQPGVTYSVYTDGSYGLTDHQFDDLFPVQFGSALGDRLQASASVILAPQDDSWEQDTPLICLRIHDGQKIGARSAYPMELIAIAAALQLSSHLTNNAINEIVSDSQSSVNLANSPATRGINIQHANLQCSIRHLRPQYHGTIRWTRAHVENRKTNYMDWTRDEKLNHVADAIAIFTETDFVNTLPDFRLIDLPAATIMQDLTVPGTWALHSAPQDSPTLGGIQQDIEEQRLRTYTEQRDQYRATAPTPRPPKWTGVTPLFAAAVFQQSKASIRSAAHNIRLFWDKGWHGGNKAKAGRTEEDIRQLGKCPLCDQQDSQRHWLLECQHPTQVAARQKHIAKAQRHVREDYSPEKTLLQATMHLATTHSEGEMVWTGMWTPALRNALQTTLNRWDGSASYNSTTKTRSRRSALLKLSVILADAASDMWVSRQNLITPEPTPVMPEREPQPVEDNPNQPPITAFFPILVQPQQGPNHPQTPTAQRSSSTSSRGHAPSPGRENPTSSSPKDSNGNTSRRSETSSSHSSSSSSSSSSYFNIMRDSDSISPLNARAGVG